MRTLIHVFPRAFVLLGAALALVACSSQDDVHQWVAQEKAKKGAPLQPLPVVRTFETFIYEADDRRDPFGASQAEEEEQASSGPRPDQNRPRELLEGVPLDGLKMSGTIGLGSDIEALLRDPDGVVHRVRVGNYAGQNYGRITSITEDRVELVELIPNGTGGWMERQATIALGEQQ